MSRMKLYFFYRRSVLIFIYTRPVAGRSTIFPMFLPLSFPYCIWYNKHRRSGNPCIFRGSRLFCYYRVISSVFSEAKIHCSSTHENQLVTGFRKPPYGNQNGNRNAIIHNGGAGRKFPFTIFKGFHPDFQGFRDHPHTGNLLQLGQLFHQIGFYIFRGLSDPGFPILN